MSTQIKKVPRSTTPAKGAAPWTPPEAAAPDPAVRGCRLRTPAVRNHPDELKQVCTPHHPYLFDVNSEYTVLEHDYSTLFSIKPMWYSMQPMYSSIGPLCTIEYLMKSKGTMPSDGI
ncbi:hypothetical protein LXL04_019817 [Taraxacum kok-saghyz]